MRTVLVRNPATGRLFARATWDGRVIRLISDAFYTHMVDKAMLRGRVLRPRDGERFLDALLGAFTCSTYVEAVEVFGREKR
jgi:hypothetical protein